MDKDMTKTETEETAEETAEVTEEDTADKEKDEGKTEPNEKEMKKEKQIDKVIKKMRWKMRTTNVLYHAVRNNPRHRDKYYLALIAEVGFENWQYVPTALRMAWESGRNNFDTLYGLIKSFNKNEPIITAFVKAKASAENAKKQDIEDRQKADEQNKTEKQVKDILDNLQVNGTTFSTTQLVQITDALLEVLAKAKKVSQQEQNEHSYIESIVSAVNQIRKP